MRKFSLSLFILGLPFISFAQVISFAQADSSRLDAGVLVLKKGLTQTISIKGEELEKMPFTDLGTALGAWLYGAYSNPTTLTYVVDGNIVSDVNMYSVYDVQEAVLVQNAAVLANLGAGMQQMVIITTRKAGQGKRGMDAAIQGGLVTAANHTSSLYHQYYVRGYEQIRNMSFGLSADFQRDALPSMKDPHVHVLTSDGLNRLRLNGFFTIRAGSKNTIEVHAGYAPQKMDSAQTTISHDLQRTTMTNATQRQHIFMPWAMWHGEWLPGLSNDLQVGYLSGLQKEEGRQGNVPASAAEDTSWHFDAHAHTTHLYVRDRISYHMKAGNWAFIPSFNASFEQFKDAAEFVQTNQAGTGPGVLDLIRDSYGKGKVYVLTPAIDFQYRNAFDFQGGVLTNASHAPRLPFHKRLYPFATFSLDVLHWISQESNTGLSLFGSYAKRDAMSVDEYALNDLSGRNSVGGFSADFSQSVFWGTTGLLYPPDLPDISNWTWSLGTQLSLWKGQLNFNYHYERFNSGAITSLSSSTGYSWLYILTKSNLHNLEISTNIGEERGLRWETRLNATILTQKGDGGINGVAFGLGDYNTKHPSWTGGWVNRLRFKDFSLGVTMQYHFNELLLDNSGKTFRNNSFLTQDIYAGYKLHLAKGRAVEVYLNGRNLIQNSHSSLTLPYKYYGMGGKIAI